PSFFSCCGSPRDLHSFPTRRSSDLKPLSKQLLLENSVSPDISNLTAHGSLGLSFSPIYGKAAVGKKIIIFDIYGSFGLGATQTRSEEHTSELQSQSNLVCRLLLEKK